MAVVANLSVNLSAQTAAFSNGLKSANKDLKTLEKQVTGTQRVMRGFNASLKSLNAIGGKLGLGGVFGGMLGGFQFARFATDSLKEHAKDNRELQGTLEDLDVALLQIKKNFGAWLNDVAGAGSIIQGFTEHMKELSGGDIDANQTLVNAGRLDTSQTPDMLRESLANAMVARDRLDDGTIARQLAHLQGQRGNDLPAESRAILEREIASLERALPQDIKNVNAEIEILQRRLAEIKASGLDTENTTEGFGKALLGGLEEGLKSMPALFDQFGDAAQDALNMAAKGMVEFDTLMQRSEEDLQDFMKGFKISEGQNPIKMFADQAAELQRLFDKGFLDDDAFGLALMEARRDLEGFTGLSEPMTSRAAGSRRGSAEAFESIARFEDRNDSVPQKLDQLIKLAEEQLRLDREAGKRTREEFDNLAVVDPKP